MIPSHEHDGTRWWTGAQFNLTSKLITSHKESSYAPNADYVFVNLAVNPSKKSQIPLYNLFLHNKIYYKMHL